jgi:hypothetical protein
VGRLDDMMGWREGILEPGIMDEGDIEGIIGI